VNPPNETQQTPAGNSVPRLAEQARYQYQAWQTQLNNYSDIIHPMGVVDDVRKLLQDLVTPEMRALAAEVKGLNEKVESLRVEMNRRFDYIETSFRLNERVSLLEAERKKPPSKQ
jgi:hypothetical protein